MKTLWHKIRAWFGGLFRHKAKSLPAETFKVGVPQAWTPPPSEPVQIIEQLVQKMKRLGVTVLFPKPPEPEIPEGFLVSEWDYDWSPHDYMWGPNFLGGSDPSYYVDATSGNDTWDGLAPEYVSGTNGPWKTIAKVNAASFSAGDYVYFKKGETWREQLTVPSSGSSGLPITFGAYGTGDAPRINGSDLITTWSAQGEPNIWQAALTTEPETTVWFDGTRGTKVASVALCNGANKWYWEANVLYVYSTSDPDTAYTNPGIEASVRASCLFTNGMDYIIVEKLHFEKSSWSNVYMNGATQSEVNYCISLNGGDIGIRLQTAASKAQNCVAYNHVTGVYSPVAASLTNSIVWNNTDDILGASIIKTTNIIEDDSDPDPLFVSAGTDFDLQAGSPCINAGTDVGLTRDYAGHIVAALPDIGAYEHMGVATVSGHAAVHLGMGMGMT